ncbi:hypothetical protein ACSQ67_010679 [Phaseolus vulgaris]
MSTHESSPRSVSSPRLVPQESSTIIEGTEVTSGDQISLFRGCVLEGRWEYVISAYRNDREYHKIGINESRGTALHVAVNDGKVELVNILVGAILSHEGREVVSADSALRSTNERGDTPLHLAASRGFIGMCKCIIGENGERKDLIRDRNNKGETPIFRAVLTCQIKAFVYFHNVSKDLDVLLWNYNEDTILHYAIWREFLGILVEPLDAEKAIKSYMEKVEKSEDHELKVNIHLENEGKKAQIFVEEKYATSVRFVKSSVRFAFKCLSLSGLGVTAQDLKAIKKIRQKHKWGRQLLNIFMKRPHESYMGISGGRPFMKLDTGHNDLVQPTRQQLQMVGVASSGQSQQENTRTESATKNEEKETTFVSVAKAGIVDLVNELQNKVPTALNDNTNPEKENLLVVAMKNIKYKLGEHHVDKKETAFLTAAKNGIVEIVFELQSKIPSAVHETTSNNENVLLVAVKNRQTNVVEVLKKNLDKELFDSLILEVDNRENTVLHLAAGTTTNTERTWQIAGVAMQMMWDIKWYQDEKTGGEIFKQKHKDLLKESSEWLKETSNSCSVVAALIAGVSFATSSSVPGGTDNGKPELEGQPAFDAFAIASLIGLCFSVTALIMFLAILTSRKQAQDFRMSLPLKLLFGLSSLFVSISSMLVSFCAAHFFVLKDKYKNILFPVYIATCLPVTFYAVLQFPLYVDLLKAIFKKVPQPSITISQF